MSIEPIHDDPFTLDGLLARFWHRLTCLPEMSADHRRYLLTLYTYSYGNELWIKQNHKREMRKRWRDLLRFRVAHRLKGRVCWVCGDPPVCWHHIVPLVRGGDNRRDNLVPLCQRCHDSVHWAGPV